MKAVWIGLGLLVVGCNAKPVATTATDNPEIKVDRLFTIDGCAVYRFDDGNLVYFARCGSSVRTSWTVNQGKGGVHHKQTLTEAQP